MDNPFSKVGDDKHNPQYTFTPPTDYTLQEVEKGQQLVQILNNSSLTENQKKDAVWEVLTQP